MGRELFMAKLAQFPGVCCQLGQMPTGGSHCPWPSWDGLVLSLLWDCCFQTNSPRRSVRDVAVADGAGVRARCPVSFCR